MADNPNLRGGRDRIARGQTYEVHGNESLGATRARLEAAIREVGSAASAVRRKLAAARR